MLHGCHKTPYDALEQNCALANFTDAKSHGCQQKPAWKNPECLKKVLSFLKIATKAGNAGVPAKAFLEAGNIPIPPRAQAFPAAAVSSASEPRPSMLFSACPVVS